MAHYFTAFEEEADAKSVTSLASTAPSTAPSFLAPRKLSSKAPVSKAIADHHRAQAISKAHNVGGQGGKGKGKGREQHWRTPMQVFKDEVDDRYHARAILLGKGGQNLKHIYEQTGLRIILEGEVPNAMQLVVVGPMPHVPALKMMKDLVEYVNDDYKQWAAPKPARHAATKKAADEAAAKKDVEEAAAKKAADEAVAAKRAAEKAEAKKAAEEAAVKKAADEAAAAKRAAEKAEAKKAAEEAAVKKAADEAAAAKRAAEKAEAKKAAEEAAVKKAADEAVAAKKAAEKAEAKKAAEEAAVKKAADEAAAAKRAAEKAEAKVAEEAAVKEVAKDATPAQPEGPHSKVQEPKLKDMIAIIREHLDFEDSCTTPSQIIAEANRQLDVQATGNIFQQARTLLSHLTEPW